MLFLYNFEARTVEGPFLASCDSRWNISPGAWRGRFKYQVQVRPLDQPEPTGGAFGGDLLVGGAVAVPLSKFHERLKQKSKKMPSKLDEQEGYGVLKLCKRLGWKVPNFLRV